MQTLQDLHGNTFWLYSETDVETNNLPNPTVSIGIGRTDQPFNGVNDMSPYYQLNPEPTGFFWVPLPALYRLYPPVAFANWTDWIEWDQDAQQLWWGKDIVIHSPSPPGDYGGVPEMSQIWVFYYQEF
jgi:hypothetical protein